MEASDMLPGVHSHRSPIKLVTVPMFGIAVRGLWVLLLLSTFLIEVIPLSTAFEAQFSNFTFHFYEAMKLVAFFVFGFLTPIAWWRYKSLGIGVLFAIITTAIVELGQAFIPGHRASILELVVKLVLLFGGFAAALDVRKYQNFNIGPLCVRFTSRYWQCSR
jgi:hypothetical protein